MERISEAGKQHDPAPSVAGQSRGASFAPLPPALELQQFAGNQAMQSLLRSGVIQAKLAISNPDDPEEREADEVADRIMRKPAGAPCSCAPGGEMCDECQQTQSAPAIQRSAMAREAPAHIPRIASDVLRSSGHPMDTATRAFFEPRFGRDFSHVRIHTDSQAEQSAAAIRANAFAIGSDLYFASGRYATGSEVGRHLLAHELAHVVQRESTDIVRRQDDGGVPDTPAPQPAVVDRVIGALQEPQENGVGDYSEAYSILNGLWIVDMFEKLEVLRTRGYFDLLKDNDPRRFQRVTLAIAAVAAKGTPAAAQFPARNPAFSSLEDQQQHEVAEYLRLPWPIPQNTTGGEQSGVTDGEILAGVLVGAAVVGSVVFFIACPECVAVLALVVSTGAADVAAGTAIDAGATVAVELVVDATAVGGEGAAVTTVLAEGATATTLTGTSTAASTTAVTSAAATTTAATTSTAATAAIAGTALATTTLSSDSPQQENPCGGPTGLTPEDPIPMTWYKVYSPSFYPTPIQVGEHHYDRDEDSQHLPHGEPLGVSAVYRPYIGKVFQLLPIERGPEADRFRAVLQGYGFDWSGLQADHVQDLQWGGDDVFNNLWPLDASANMSAGPRQNDNQAVTFCNSPTGTLQTMTLRQMKAAGVVSQYFGRWFVIANITI